MDPSRNISLQSAKLPAIPDFQNNQLSNNINLGPPPSYDMAVGANSPNGSRIESPYDLDEMEDPFRMEREREQAAAAEEDEDEDEEEEIPEVNIHADTQIRGHGNIISIAQLDSVRIATLVAGLLHGYPLPTMPPTQQQQGPSSEGHAVTSPQTAQAVHRPPPVHQNERNPPPKYHININCGAVVIGDRNIVGPGLGDIARHLQMTQQRNQALAAQQAQQSQMNANRAAAMKVSGAGGAGGSYCPVPCGPGVGIGHPIHGQPHPHMATPPMSRSSSLGTEEVNVLKRAAEEGVEDRCSKRTC